MPKQYPQPASFPTQALPAFTQPCNAAKSAVSQSVIISATVDTVRQHMWRPLANAKRPDFKPKGLLYLKNPESLQRDERTRFLGLLRLML